MRKLDVLIKIAGLAVIVSGAFFVYFAYLSVQRILDERAVRQTGAEMHFIFDDFFQARSLNEADETALDDSERTGGLTEANEINAFSVYESFTAEENNATENMPSNPVFAARELTGNSDIVGFIYIPGTSIKNLVVQGRDNIFYLNHDVYGRRNSHGELFLDYNNSRDFGDTSSIIYGHNMRNGTMFFDLRLFAERGFFLQNRFVYIVTEFETITYEIFAVFSASVHFNYIQTDFAYGEFERLINDFLRLSYFNADGISVLPDDQILVLSTCTNVNNDTRFVVVSRRI